MRGCALKQTASGGFVHVACALWVDGIEIADLRRMQPICGVLSVQEMQTRSAIKIHAEMLRLGLGGIEGDDENGDGMRSNHIDHRLYDQIGRWSHHCIVCGDDNGCFVECADSECIRRVHVLCGWFAGFHLRIEVDAQNGNMTPLLFCLEHTPSSHGGRGRNLSYFKAIRGNGLFGGGSRSTTNSGSNDTDTLSREQVIDQYPSTLCAVCFGDDASGRLMRRCTECRVQIHSTCYGIMDHGDIESVNDWKCDICCHSEHEMKRDHDSQSMMECIACHRRGGAMKRILIQNDGDNQDQIGYIHVCCGQFIDCIRYEMASNLFVVNRGDLESRSNEKERQCLFCSESNGITVKCTESGCTASFHVVCGLFGGCDLRARRTKKGLNHNHNENGQQFEFVFLCRSHSMERKLKFKALETINDRTSKHFDFLGEHLLNIKRLRLKLDKIQCTKQRINEYQLAQRGILNEHEPSTTRLRNESNKMRSKERKREREWEQSRKVRDDDMAKASSLTPNSKRRKKQKHRKRHKSKRKEIDDDSLHRHPKDDGLSTSKATTSGTDTAGNTVSDVFVDRYNIRSSRSAMKKKTTMNKSTVNESFIDDRNVNDDVVDGKEERIQRNGDGVKSKVRSRSSRKKRSVNGVEIRMPTDFWAEQYQYEGGEIKVVEKRNGIFVSIPRLRLPKGNKYRYSHLERRQKEQLLHQQATTQRVRGRAKRTKGSTLSPSPSDQRVQNQNEHSSSTTTTGTTTEGNNAVNESWMNFLEKIKEKEQEMKAATESETASKPMNLRKSTSNDSNTNRRKRKFNELSSGPDVDSDQSVGTISKRKRMEDEVRRNREKGSHQNSGLPFHLQKYLNGGSGWELIVDRNRSQKVITKPESYRNCPYCDRVKTKKISVWNWNRHLNAIHWFRCTHCGRSFTSHSKLMDHLDEKH